MTVNALWFWFAVELLLIAAGAAIYLAHRWRKLARRTEAERRAWDEQRAAARAVVEDAVGAARAAGEAQRQEFLLRLLACLEKSRAKRPQTARDLAQLLNRSPAAGQWNVDAADEWWNRHERSQANPLSSTAAPVTASPANERTIIGDSES